MQENLLIVASLYLTIGVCDMMTSDEIGLLSEKNVVFWFFVFVSDREFALLPQESCTSKS